MAQLGRASYQPARSDGARFRARAREPSNQTVVGMKLTPENDCFKGGALAPGESRFEKLEIGPFRETAMCAQFGWKLQNIFPLPSGSSEPENVRILLREIKSKLDGPAVPGDG